MDATMATTVAALLAQKAAGALAGEAGKSAWAGMGRLSEAVRGRFAHDSEAQASLDALDSHPDAASVRSVAGHVQARAATDPEFSEELVKLVREAEEDLGTTQITLITGNAIVGKVVTIRDVKGDVSF